jgi:hypothetical protein
MLRHAVESKYIIVALAALNHAAPRGETVVLRDDCVCVQSTVTLLRVLCL